MAYLRKRRLVVAASLAAQAIVYGWVLTVSGSLPGPIAFWMDLFPGLVFAWIAGHGPIPLGLTLMVGASLAWHLVVYAVIGAVSRLMRRAG